jgi:hypothetical protein
MKKFAGVIAVVIAAGMFAGCGEKKSDPSPTVQPTPQRERIQVYQVEEVTLPDWYYDEEAVVKKEAGDSVSYIYFKFERELPNRQNAIRAAEADMQGAIANIIKNVTSTEMVKATEGMLNDAGEMDEYYSQTIASISRNVDTSGLMPAGRVVEHLARRDPSRERDETFYRATVRYKMDYQTFVDRLMGLVNKEAPRINERLKEQGQKLLEETKMRENMMELAQ